jgi:hypothetical protein
MRNLVFAIVLVVCVFGCKQVDFTAPGGSTLTLSAQPSTIDKNGSSTLTVTGTRAGGAPLPDGTVVRFTISGAIGTIFPNPVELRGGVAVVRFVGGQQAGDATITVASGDATADATVSIGQRKPSSLILTADPSSIGVGGGRSKLRAFVFDEDGNPMTGVKVFFETDKGSLASHGQPVETDGAGVAKDTLSTIETAQVTATTSNAISDQLEVGVTEAVAVTCGLTVTPSTTVTLGDPVLFADTSSDPDGQVTSSTWDFGDGSSGSGQSVQHTYGAAGTFFVIHTVTDDQGFIDTCDPVTITVSEPTS